MKRAAMMALAITLGSVAVRAADFTGIQPVLPGQDAARMELPMGWRATVYTGGQSHEVRELGWPTVPLAPGTAGLRWEVMPAAGALPVDHVVVLRFFPSQEEHIMTVRPTTTTSATEPRRLRRLPLLEWPSGQFQMPPHQGLIGGEFLLHAVRIDTGLASETLTAEQLPFDFLHNVEPSARGFQRRVENRRPGAEEQESVYTLTLPASVAGARLRIQDERLRGRTQVAVQLAMGPECGVVAIRDCEGRLAGVADQWLDESVAIPQLLHVRFEVPSRDDWFFLETVAPGHGGRYHVGLQRVLILDEEEPRP